jgi:hypothetical protein
MAVLVSSFVGVLDQFATTWEGVASGEKRVLTSVMAGDNGVMRRYLVQLSSPTRAALGETLDLDLPDWTMVAHLVSLSFLGASVFTASRVGLDKLDRHVNGSQIKLTN